MAVNLHVYTPTSLLLREESRIPGERKTKLSVPVEDCQSGSISSPQREQDSDTRAECQTKMKEGRRETEKKREKKQPVLRDRYTVQVEQWFPELDYVRMRDELHWSTK